MLTDEQIRKICEYMNDRPVEAVYLFGSQATNDARPDSDYDFGVLFEDSVGSSERFELRLEMMGLLTGMFKTDNVDVLDLNSSPIRFQYEAIKPRKLIYEKNSAVVKDFENRVLTGYLDEAYHLKQATRDYLSQVASVGIL